MKSNRDLLRGGGKLSIESRGHIISGNVGFLTGQSGVALMTVPDIMLLFHEWYSLTVGLL